MNAPYGRDPRRFLSTSDSRFLYERAKGLCQRCGVELDARWHGAHLTSHTHGGATSVEQMEAWCWRCNLKLGPRDAANAPVFTPRVWQQDALPPLLEAIYHNGVATLHAAPGAGKTFEVGWVFQALYDAGIVRRLLVVVPTTPLITQWVEELGKLKIHLDSSPRKGVFELPGTVGGVVCYQSIPGAAESHAVRMDQVPTMVAWDEVHHLGDRAAWGAAARKMVGDVESGGIEHATAVLNVTGTLFRSSKRSRIATVRYRPIATTEGEKLQARDDYSVTTADLVGTELRRPDLYVYDGQARLVDLRTEEVIIGEIADLDQQQRQAVMRESFTSRSWLRGYCEEAIVLLKRQLATPVGEEEPLKLLYIAQHRRAARLAADMLNEVTKEDFARLVIGDEKDALKRLSAAKREKRSCAIVAVQMVTEGFDCNHIATMAYASNKTAPLFIAQAMARNMRVTATERKNGRLLPAQNLVPNNPDIRKAFASALVSAVHEIDEEEDICRRCGLPKAECICPGGPPPSNLPRYQLLDLDDPRLRHAVVLGHDDGEVDGKELEDQWLPVCSELGIWETLAPRVAVAARRVRPTVQIYAEPEGVTPDTSSVSDPHPGPVREPANPRDVNLAYRRDVLKKAPGWMMHHVAHDGKHESIGSFQTGANRAADIPFDKNGKGMRDSATADQLRVASEWMCAEITRHCDAHDCRPPKWLEDDETL